MTTGGQAFLTMYHRIISYSFNINQLSRNAPQCALLIFFTCLTPDDFTCQWGSSAAWWGNQKNWQSLYLTHWTAMSSSAPWFFFTCLMPDDFSNCQWEALCSLMCYINWLIPRIEHAVQVNYIAQWRSSLMSKVMHPV